jgi:hypothetical protein
MVSRSVATLLTAAAIIFITPLSASADDFKFGKITDADWQQGAPVDYSDADAIILRDEGFMTVDLNAIQLERHIRIKILTEAGIEEAADQSVWWYKDDKVKNLKAHTITPDGKKHKVKGDAIFKKSSGNYRAKVLTYPQVSVGSILELKYKIISQIYGSLDPWYFQNDLYTLDSKYSVKLYPGFEYTVIFSNVPGSAQEAKVTEERQPGGTFAATINTFTWSMVNLPPVTDEPYMAAEDVYRSSLRFMLLKFENRYNRMSFQKNWSERGAGFQERVIDDYVNKRGDIKKLAEEVTSGLASPEEKSRAIYKYVSSNYHTEHEFGGWLKNDKISELLETKSGSGEEKNILVAEMHRAVGIEAWPVMVGTRSKKRFNHNICSLAQFNYIITFVKIGDHWEFLDAASKYSPYGILPPELHAEGGLMLDGENSQPVRLIIEPIASFRSDHIRLFVDSDGAAVCSTISRFGGYYAAEYADRWDRRSPDDFIETYFAKRLCDNPTVGLYDCSVDSANCFTVALDFTTDELAEYFENTIVLNNLRYAFRENPFSKPRRFFPVDFTYPFVYQSIFEVHAADSTGQITLPDPVTYSIDGASVEVTSFVQDGFPVISTKLMIERPVFSPGEYDALRDLFARFAETTNEEVAIILLGE